MQFRKKQKLTSKNKTRLFIITKTIRFPYIKLLTRIPGGNMSKPYQDIDYPEISVI